MPCWNAFDGPLSCPCPRGYLVTERVLILTWRPHINLPRIGGNRFSIKCIIFKGRKDVLSRNSLSGSEGRWCGMISFNKAISQTPLSSQVMKECLIWERRKLLSSNIAMILCCWYVYAVTKEMPIEWKSERKKYKGSLDTRHLGSFREAEGCIQDWTLSIKV